MDVEEAAPGTGGDQVARNVAGSGCDQTGSAGPVATRSTLVNHQRDTGQSKVEICRPARVNSRRLHQVQPHGVG
jgi:hypothetical protein